MQKLMSTGTTWFTIRQAVKGRITNPRFISTTERKYMVSSLSSPFGIRTPDDEHTLYDNAHVGEGHTLHIAKNCRDLKMLNVCVMTDKSLANTAHWGPVQKVVRSLKQAEVLYILYDDVLTEPTDSSFKDAIQFAKDGAFDGFIAVGGGSVIDTCKAANLYASNPSASFMDYVSAPVGYGKTSSLPVKPLISVPTVASTISHMTGTSFSLETTLKTRATIFNQALRPTISIVDALNSCSVPKMVAVYSGLGLLCTAMEALTCKRSTDSLYTDYKDRPLFQGANTKSDGLCARGLKVASWNLDRVVFSPENLQCLRWMMRASTMIAVGADNAGLHLCHAMGSAISSHVKDFVSEDYDQQRPMIPHGLSLIVIAPAVFAFTAKALPDTHLHLAEDLGVDVRKARCEDAGKIVAHELRRLMERYGCPNGLKALGFTSEDVPMLVNATLAQTRMTSLCPRKATGEDYAQIFMDSMTVY